MNDSTNGVICANGIHKISGTAGGTMYLWYSYEELYKMMVKCTNGNHEKI